MESQKSERNLAGNFNNSSNSLAVARYCVKKGRELQERFPEVADDYKKIF